MSLATNLRPRRAALLFAAGLVLVSTGCTTSGMQPTVVSDRMIAWHDTRGELAAQCDVEEMNWLALNLAHDVAMGRRTPADARAFYGRTAMAFKQGDRSSPYVRGPMFQQEPDAADPDRPMQM